MPSETFILNSLLGVSFALIIYAYILIHNLRRDANRAVNNILQAITLLTRNQNVLDQSLVKANEVLTKLNR